jgi:hypothetical protein
MPAASLRALLAHAIDYAGMFPPCSLGLESALKNQAEYVRTPDASMLGAFVLSAEQFDATKQLLSQFDAQHPLRVAALGPKTASTDAFLEALDDAEAAIRSLSRHNVDLISIGHLEMFLPHDVNAVSLQEAKSILGDLPVFWEAPPDRAEQTIALLAGFNSDADSATFGYKLRTGGVTADAFPTAMQIASRSSPSGATIQRGSQNKDARFPECVGRGGARCRASMGYESNLDDARRRKCGFVFVH